jgi:hypothetical protein
MARLWSGQGMVGELLVARSLMVPMALPRPGLAAAGSALTVLVLA